MSPKELTALRIDPELMKTLRAVKVKEGIPITAQVDLALRAWLKAKGFVKKTARKRAVTRKRA